jgi:hypothetical protein
MRGGAGLGDALYVQAVARHLRAQGKSLTIFSDWPDVFLPLLPQVNCAPFRRSGVDLLAHYSPRKGMSTKQFEDCCIQAGVKLPVELRLDWSVTDPALVTKVTSEAGGRPIVCLQLPRAPMGRTDGFGAELLPDCRVIQRIVDRIASWAFIVQVGSGAPLFRFSGVHLDLADRTTVRQMLDVASIADGFLGYVSFFVPLAESFDRPALLVWSEAGLKSPRPFIRQITPEKVLFRETSRWVLDTWPAEAIERVVDDFLR